MMKDWVDDYYKASWKTALERAVDKNRSSIVYFFVKEYHQDISRLDKVRS